MSDLADFAVGDRVVRPSLGQVLNGQQPVHVEPRSIDVLIALAERPGEVHPKRELIEAVWGSTFVSDEVLTHAIWDLRRAFGDDASHPRYIQTIPKRGYRLIAPVKPVEPEPRARRSLLAVGIGVVILALAAVFFLTRDAPETASETEPRQAAAYALTLVRSAADGAAPELVGSFHESLGGLAGTTGLAVLPDATCPEIPADDAYCLQTAVSVLDGRHQASAQLVDSSTGEVVWKPESAAFTDPAGAETAAAELRELTAAYFEIIDMSFYRDPDIVPWFEIARHDLRAIRDFLLGVEYTYRHEIGARNALDLAAARDPGFVAPRVWRVPALHEEGERELLDRYLSDLERLQASARPFEQAMTFLARAMVAGDVASQIRHLETALRIEPDNRPLQLTLGASLLAAGDAERAWRILEPLARTRWRHRGLYATAGAAGLLAGKLERAEEVLRLALPRHPVDPEVLALLEILAVYRGDREAAAAFRRQLARRIELIRPETFSFDRGPYLEHLAGHAQEEGRTEIARRLREFAG